MAFIGNQPAESFTSFATQEFSTSATTSYTLDHAVTNENEIALFVNNVRQQPGSGKAYTATGTALTLSAATASTDTMYCVFLGRALQTVTPATNSITAAMVGNDLISGKDALASAPADTDEFLVSDAGVLKRIDYSLIKAANSPSFRATMSANQTGLSMSTQTLVQFNTETWDVGSCFNTSNYRFIVPSGEDGKYCITAHVHTRVESGNTTGKSVRLNKNGSFLTETVDSLDSNLYNTRSNHQQITAIEDLSADDYIEVYSLQWQGGSSGTTNIQTEASYFTAFKLIGV